MGFQIMTTITQDTFTDTDGVLLQNHTPNIGAGWTKISGDVDLKILGNAAQPTGNGVYGYATTSTAAVINQIVEAKLKVGTVGRPTIAGRHNGTTTYYSARHRSAGNQANLRKTINNVHTILGTFGFTIDLNIFYLYRLECKSDAKKIFIDNIERISSPDDTITTGLKAGIDESDNPNPSSTYDDFKFDDLLVANFLVLDGSIAGDMSADMKRAMTIIDGILSGDDAPGVDPGPYRLQIFVESPMTRTIDVVSTLR